MKWQLPYETRLEGKALYDLFAVVANTTLECKNCSKIKYQNTIFGSHQFGMCTNNEFPKQVGFESNLVKKGSLQTLQ